MLMERGTGRWDRLGEDQHRITAADMGALSWMNEHAQDWPPRRGEQQLCEALACRGTQSWALGLPGSSFCKSKGRWKKTQCRRAGELEDQSRKTEVSLATQGGNGTNSSTATRWIHSAVHMKLHEEGSTVYSQLLQLRSLISTALSSRLNTTEKFQTSL